MCYNLVTIFVIVKYFLKLFHGRRQEMSNYVKLLCLLLFFYGIIFIMSSRSFVVVSNFVCGDVDG